MMTASAKTLTVTYGAFACTLDGYDDPMPVLRDVVAFFRQLTAEDAGFGTIAPPEGTELHVSRPSPLTPEEIAALGTAEDGESELTAAALDQSPLQPPDAEDEDLFAATMPGRAAATRAAEEPARDPVPAGGDGPAPLPEAVVPSGPDLLLLTPDLRIDNLASNLMPHEQQYEQSLPARDATVGLAEFIRECGAETLADRMEATAAHAMVLEGRASLSRPSLLRAMQDLGPEPVGFEEGLRAFGTLLHSGRLRKADYGRYTVAEDSRFMAAARGVLA